MRHGDAENDGAAPTLALILAGGKSLRMQGTDKAEFLINRERMIDRVIRQISAQVDDVYISGRTNYNTGLKNIPDLPTGPGGPVAGLNAAFERFKVDKPQSHGFVTVPVDCPDVPTDLFERLYRDSVSTIAFDGTRQHPTFSYWRMKDLAEAIQWISSCENLSIREVANKIQSTDVIFSVQEVENCNSGAEFADVQSRLAE